MKASLWNSNLPSRETVIYSHHFQCYDMSTLLESSKAFNGQNPEGFPNSNLVSCIFIVKLIQLSDVF